jgi:hypothetical protein
VTLRVYTLRRAEELRNCANNPAQSRSTKAAAFVCRLFFGPDDMAIIESCRLVLAAFGRNRSLEIVIPG